MQCRTSSGNNDFEKPYHQTDTDYFRTFYRASSKTLEFRIKNGFTTNTVEITIYYTKTTD